MPEVQDFFTEASDTQLNAHTPDTGIGWTEVFASGSMHQEIVADSDSLHASNTGSSRGAADTAQPAPTVAEYDLEYTINNLDTSTSQNNGIGVFARRTDNDNVYGLQTLQNGVTPSNKKIFKRVAGTNTELGAEDTILVDEEVIKFEIRDATKKCFQAAVERISTTDDALTAAGTWGFARGDFPVFGDSNGSRITGRSDNFAATEQATAGGSLLQLPHHMRAGFNQLHGGFSE